MIQIDKLVPSSWTVLDIQADGVGPAATGRSTRRGVSAAAVGPPVQHSHCTQRGPAGQLSSLLHLEEPDTAMWLPEQPAANRQRLVATVHHAATVCVSAIVRHA